MARRLGARRRSKFCGRQMRKQRSHEAERDRPGVLVPFEGQVKSEQEIQRLENDGKAAAEQASPDQRKQSGEPETVIEQPEGLVALAPAGVSREADRRDQGTKEQREEEPHLPLEAEQKGDGGNAGEPGDGPHHLRAPVRLDKQVDGQDPKEGCGERPENFELGLTRVAGPELEGCEETGEEHGEWKAREGCADIRQPASPRPASRSLCHDAPPYADWRKR